MRQQNGTTSRYWCVLDGRGNVVAVTDPTGNVVDRYSYDVWGALSSVSESVPQRLRYAGYWYDQELGWYWVSVRMYDPSLKRWLQPDRSHTDGVRTYMYVGDDPVDETDPTGLQGGAAVALGAGTTVGAGAVCVGTILVPILGELDCVTAAAILGTAIVASLFAAEYPYVSTPGTSTTVPAYAPRPGEVQSTPVSGGTTLTTPAQIPLPNVVFAKGGKKNITNEYVRMVREQIQQTGGDPCKILKVLYDNEKDPQERQKIYTARKAFGCQRKQKR